MRIDGDGDTIGILGRSMTRREFVRTLGMAAATATAGTALSGCSLPFFGKDGDGSGAAGSGKLECAVIAKASDQSNFALDPILASTTTQTEIIAHIMSGLARWDIVDGVLVIRPDVAEELPEPEKNDDGTWTYTYAIREDAMWSDGMRMTADDFVFAWNRAAMSANQSPSRYMFDCIKGFSSVDDGGRLSVQALDPRTLSVTLTKRIPYWDDLLAFPAFMPMRSDFVPGMTPVYDETGEDFDYRWMKDYENCPYSGPYCISLLVEATYQEDTGNTGNNILQFKKNTYYHDADAMGPDEIRFVYGKSTEEQLNELEQVDNIQLSDDVVQTTGFHILTNAGAALLQGSKDKKSALRRATPLLGTYWLAWNVNNRLLLPDDDRFGSSGENYELAQAQIRRAFNLLVNRAKAVENDIAAKAASGIVPPGISDTGGVDFASNSGAYYDVSEGSYDANTAQAVEILRNYYHYDEETGKFVDVPTFVVTSSSGAAAPITVSALINFTEPLGIHMEHEGRAYEELAEKMRLGDGSFDIVYGNWFADFVDPVTFLTLWTTTSAQNSAQFGRGQHASARIYSLDLSTSTEEHRIEKANWSETYDYLMGLVDKEEDFARRSVLLHKAEDLVMSTGAIMPVIHPSAPYVIKNTVEGLVATPFNWMFYGKLTQKA